MNDFEKEKRSKELSNEGLPDTEKGKGKKLVPMPVKKDSNKIKGSEKELAPTLNKKKINPSRDSSKVSSSLFKKLVWLIIFIVIGGAAFFLRKSKLLRKLFSKARRINSLMQDPIREELKLKETKLTELGEKHQDIQGKLQGITQERSDLAAERNNLRKRINQLQEKIKNFEERLSGYKNLEGQLVNINTLLEKTRNQREQLEKHLKQNDKKLKGTFAWAKDLEQKLVQKEKKLSETETTLEELSQKKEPKFVDKLQSQVTQLTQQSKQSKEMKNKLQRRHQNDLAKMEDAIYPSLDLTPLEDKGVLLKIEPTGPVVPIKKISIKGVSFEWGQKLNIPKTSKITLIFFGSFSPLTVKAQLIWQIKFTGFSKYNIRLRYVSLKQNDKKKISQYINKIKKRLNRSKK